MRCKSRAGFQAAHFRSNAVRLRTTIAAFLSACFGALILTAHGAGAEALQFVNSDLQIGAVTADTNVPVTFVLTNRSDKAVKIAGADSSCRCTSLQKSPEEIPAHGSGAFEWTFNSSRATGAVTQVVEVDATDGQIIIGQFHATVEPPVETAALHVSTNTITPPAAYNLATGLDATNAAGRPATIRKGGISGPGKPPASGEK